jgi:hypothetical protein
MHQVPIIVALRNPGMRARHWEALSEKIGKYYQPQNVCVHSIIAHYYAGLT